jgi:hypothetical protein
VSASSCGQGRVGAEFDEPPRIGLELLQTAVAAEVVGLALVLDVAGCVIRRDRHAANRVEDSARLDRRVMVGMRWHSYGSNLTTQPL